MTSPTDPPRPTRASRWASIAAALLGLQGLNRIFYAGFIPPPITDAGVSVPLLGHLPFVWLVVGGIALAAAIGIMRRRAWGRLLGIASEIVTIAAALATMGVVLLAVPTLMIASIVIFALWRRWPGPDEV